MQNYDFGSILEDFVEPPTGLVHKMPPADSRWLYSLCHDVLGMNDENYAVGLQPETHMELCVRLEEAVGDCKFAGSTQKLVHIELPRGTYKTSIACEGLTVGMATINPNIRTLIVNADHDSSKKRIKGCKWHFARNPEFAEVYGDDWKPNFQEDIWSATQLTVSRRTLSLREPTIDTASVGKDMTGSHYDCIVADDLVNRKNVYSPESRTEVHEYLMSLLALLDPGGVLIVIGTRWHADDAYGRILKNDEKRVRKGLAPMFETYIRSCWDGPNGLFFGKKLSREFLDEQRVRTGSRFFAANYENKPVADEDRLFDMNLAQLEDFNYVNNGRQGFVQSRYGVFPVDVTMTWDPAGRTPNRNSDSHGISVIGTDQFERWWSFEAQAYKALPSSVVDRMCNLIAHYKPRQIIIESVGGFGLWIDLLNAELIRRGLRVAIQEDTVGNQSKAVRIAMLEPRWNNRSIFLKPAQEVLIQQFTDFSPDTVMVHEDVLDAFAKHVGNTIAANDAPYEQYNPRDPEWDAYLKEKRLDDGTQVSAGRFGTRWSR